MKSPKIIRKKLIAGLAVLALAAMFGLMACSGGNSDNSQEAQDAQDAANTQLEQQNERADEVSGTQENEAEDESAGTKFEDAVDAEGFKLHLDDMSGRVDDAAKKADATEVPQEPDDRPAAFLEAVSPLDKLAAELEEIAGQLEMSYNNGSVNTQEFWDLEQRLGQIEDKLDAAEDNLEERMTVEG